MWLRRMPGIGAKHMDETHAEGGIKKTEIRVIKEVKGFIRS